MKRHNDVNIVRHQPICHYAAPLLARIKTNVIIGKGKVKLV